MADAEQLPLAMDQGTADALRYIAAQELYWRKEYEACKVALTEALALQMLPREQLPPALDGLDAKDLDNRVLYARRNLTDAEERLHKWQKSLREFDKQVDPAKRDATDKLPRSEIVQYLRMLAWHLNSAVETAATRIASEAPGIKTPEDYYAKHRESWDQGKRNSIDAALREQQLPAWVADAILE